MPGDVVQQGVPPRPTLCPRLIGRLQELGAIAQLFASVAAGQGGTIFVFGEAGVGKSRVVRAAAQNAHHLGQFVLTGRAVPAGRAIAFRPLSEALMSAFRSGGPPPLAGLSPFRAALGRLVPEWREPGDSDLESSNVMLGEGLLRLLDGVGGHAGVVLILEDLHWADPDTLAVLEYMSDHVAEVPIAILATLRTDEPAVGLSVARSLVARRAAMPLELSRLSEAEVDEMARACLDVPEVAGPVRDVLLSRAEGLPFLIEELLATSIGSGVLIRQGTEWTLSRRGDGVVPQTFADTIRRRLNSLGEPGTRILRVGALLVRRFDLSLLASILRLDPLTVSADLRRAVEAQLLDVGPDRVRFRHALTRDAVLAELLPHERTALARHALSAIRALNPELHGELCELSAQLAEDAGDLLGAAALLLEIGRRALLAGALSTAETTLERARALAADDAMLSVDIDEVQTEVLALEGKTERVFEVGTLLLDRLERIAGSEPRRAEAHVRLARAAVVSTQWSLANNHLACARALARVGRDARLCARLDVLAAQAALGEGRLEESDTLAQTALESAERVSLAEVACEALEILGRRARQRDVDVAEIAFMRAFRIAESHDLPIWRLRALHELGTIDMFRSGGLERLEQARELANTAGALGTVAILDLQLAAVHCFRVEPELAIAAARRCAAASRWLRLGVALPRALVQEATGYALLGRKVEMEAAITEALALAEDDLEVAAGAWGIARAMFSLFQERREAALQALEEAMRLARQQPTAAPYVFRPVWGLLRTIEGTDGPLALAEARAGDVSGIGLNRAILGYADAVAFGRARRPAEAAAAFADADSDLAGQSSSEVFRQLVRRLVAESALAEGWGEPVVWLSGAATFFEATGHARVVAACRLLLRKAGVPLPRRGRGDSDVPAALQKLGVTSREMDVLLLVSERLSNKEIGSRLYLSPRTVEKHVEQLLSKTGARVRADLASVIGRAQDA